MNEKNNCFGIIIVLLVIIIGCTAGYFIGRGNTRRSEGLRDANQRLAATVDELERDLRRERAISQGLRELDQRQRMEIATALDAVNGLGNGISATAAKAEILVRLVRDLEYGPYGDCDLSGGE